MIQKNVLVFPCGSEIGLDIYSSVKYSTYFHLIGANSVEDHGKFVYEDFIGGVPYINDPEFIPTLSKIVKERHIDAIFPTMDSVITITKLHESELGCRVITSPYETTEICLSKNRTYEKFRGIINVPKIFDSDSIPMNDYPVFAKPDVGYSGKGTKLLHSPADVQSFLMGKKNMLILEYLPGEEFTVDCFTNKSGVLLYCGARKRNRINNGISVNTFFVDNQTEFLELAEIINSKVVFRGAWFYQVKRNKNGELVLMEIASRLGGSSLLSRAKGVNLALLSLFDAFDYDVVVSQNEYSVVLDRALESKYQTDLEFKSVYCDYDDCLILNNNKVNTELVGFLFRCLNDGKELFLISKHENSDLLSELQKFRLNVLFDKVIHIPQSANKSEYIDLDKKPIFIDDSNSERINVQRKLKIPVFAPEMVDVLL